MFDSVIWVYISLVIVFLAIVFVWISQSTHGSQTKFLLNCTAVSLAIVIYFLGFWMPSSGITTCFWFLSRVLYVILLVLSVAWIGMIVFGSPSSTNPLGPLTGAVLLTLIALTQQYIRDPISQIFLLGAGIVSLGLITLSTVSVYNFTEIPDTEPDDIPTIENFLLPDSILKK